jgi:hypothetical protein
MNIRILFTISALAITLGAIPGWSQRLPQSGVDGATAGLDRIEGTVPDELAFAIVTIPDTDSVWHCVATCSVEAGFISGSDAGGRLALARGGAEVPGTDRKFVVGANEGLVVVSTTGRVSNLSAGPHRFACKAAKLISSDPDFNINDSSITIACSRFHL